MPPRYTEITLHEMTEVLEVNGFEFYNDPQAGEYVFQKYIDYGDKQYTLKLYTSISRYNNTSREVGSDAIRLVVCSGGKHFAEGRINRTQNWITNLKKRISTWSELFKVCPQCKDGILKERAGKYGLFYGCSTYPKCGYTEKID